MSTEKAAFGRAVMERHAREMEMRSLRRPRGALESRGGSLEAPRMGGLEKIIRDIDRPSLLVQRGTFLPTTLPTWRAVLENARPRLERAIAGVGRVEVEYHGRRVMLGTAWLVAPGVVVTNRHVAVEFARYGAGGTFPLRTDPLRRPLQVFVDFKREQGQSAMLQFRVEQVVHIEPDDDVSPDIALLRISEKAVNAAVAAPPPLVLSSAAPIESQLVACLGYPARDPDEINQVAMQQYFQGQYEVKRLAPGVVIPAASAAWAFAHDASTLGGSSGSPLVDLIDGTVVGLHFSGISGKANFAVRASAVADLLARLKIPAARPSGTPSPETPGTTPTEAGEERAGRVHKPSHFEGRKGYDGAFLGVPVPLPQPAAARIAEVATIAGGSGAELKYTHFSVIHNRQRRFPWITAVNINGKNLHRPPRPNGWFRDGRLEPDEQAGDELYTNSGFSRGHMIRRLDPCWGEDEQEYQQANEDTFHFTNACPQEQNGFNDSLWGDLEDYILDEADAEDIRISVFTGPMFAETDPFLGDLSIPLSFWKIVAWRDKGTKKLKAVGFVLSQEPFIEIELAGGPYRTSERSLASIATEAGIELDAALLAADVHAGEEARRRPLESLSELARHFSRA